MTMRGYCLYTTDLANQIKPENRNTFGHALIYHYEHSLNVADEVRSDKTTIDKMLLRIFFQDINTIIENLNVAMPSEEEVKEHGAETVMNTVGPQFHKAFRQVDVFSNGHLDMAAYVALRADGTIFWKSLEFMSRMVSEFVKTGEGSWNKFIEDRILKEYQ